VKNNSGAASAKELCWRDMQKVLPTSCRRSVHHPQLFFRQLQIGGTFGEFPPGGAGFTPVQNGADAPKLIAL
jgi:hypothetical protein